METQHGHYFTDLEDWRRDHRKLHKLSDILLLCVSAILCGASTFAQIEIFGQEHQKWFSKHGDFSNGIPSHDTIRWILCVPDPLIFSKIMTSWAMSVAAPLPVGGTGSVIAIDRKAIRGAWDEDAREGLMLVSAWASDVRVCLGVLRVESKTNEIAAVKQLLGIIDLKGKIITADALNTQKEVCEMVVSGGGDYVLALKGNHPTMYAEARSVFESIDEKNPFKIDMDTAESQEKGHGRVETRKCEIISRLGLFGTEAAGQWPGLKTLARVTRGRGFYDKGEWVEQEEVACYISSIACRSVPGGTHSANAHLGVVRQHWGIENGQHYVLDVVLGEEDCYVRKSHAPENLSICRRAGTGLASQNKPPKTSLKSTLYKAAFNDVLRKKILFSPKSDA